MSPAEREQTIVDSLPLIKHVAHRVAVRLPANIEIRDLINAGALGLLDAVDKFEAERGVKFKTYAEVRIRGAIIDSLRALDWAPRSLRKKSKAVERAYNALGQKLGRPATDEEASEALGEKIEDFHALLDQLHGLTVGSLESPSVENEEGMETVLSYYPDDGANNPYVRFEANELTKVMAQAIDALPERERLVLSLYYFEEFTMKEIGTFLGVNESRVSQLHTKATARLRTKLTKFVSNSESGMQASSH